MASRDRLAGKIVIVTGASSGIGRASAVALSREGATTVLASRSEARLEQVADSIRRLGRDVLVVPTDVSDPKQVDRLVDETVGRFGRVDVLFNNAGTASVGPVDGGRFADDVGRLLEVSFYGTLYGVQAALPVMRRQGEGQIVNMSSVVGRKAFPQFGAYSIAMHALAALTDSLRQELRGTGITVTSVHPALTQTALLDEVDPADMPPPFRAMTPITPEYVAAGIVRAVRRRRARVILPFQPRTLLAADAVSVAFGDLVVRLLSKPAFTTMIGMYRGRVYHHT
ncbi:MAG: SDR family oxidoreductase [Actinomycetota bacterium]